MLINRIKKRVFLLTCLTGSMALILACLGFSAKPEKKYLILEIVCADHFYLYQKETVDMRRLIGNGGSR